MQLKLYDRRPTPVQLLFVCQSTFSTHKKGLLVPLHILAMEISVKLLFSMLVGLR